MTQNISNAPTVEQVYPFDPECSQWMVLQGGGHFGTLDECLKTMFDHIPARVVPASYQAIRQQCLEKGYVSIHGWVVCYVTNCGESTL